MLLLCTVQTYRRIVRVDLKFPEKPVVSEGAKDFIRKVCVSITRCAEHLWGGLEVLPRYAPW